MKRRAYFYVETRLDLLLPVAMRKYKLKLSSLNEHEKCALIKAIKETVKYYMEQGWSYGMATATAAAQANFGKCEVMRALQKEADLGALRDKYKVARRFNRKKFILGVVATKEALAAFDALESKK